MGGSAYLKAVGTAIFLALAAYACAAFTGISEKPHTVSAEELNLSCSESAEGTVLRDESFVLCSGRALITAKDGVRVSNGAELAGTGRKIISSPCAGYFCTDLECTDSEAPENAIGRIVSGLTWRYSASMDTSKLKKGDSVTIRTEKLSFPAVVESVRKNSATFLCKTGVRDVLNIRELKADIVFSEKSGFKVPLSAIHRDSHGPYVNVLAGEDIRRADVTVTFKSDDYCLVIGDIRQGMPIIF